MVLQSPLKLHIFPMLDDCKNEIKQLHQFFEDWFCGRLPNTDEAFQRLPNVLASKFEMITPASELIFRDTLIKQVRSMHGAYMAAEKPSIIRTKNIEGRIFSDDLSLMRYEEWQENGDHTDAQGRLSSALFRRLPQAPNHVQWLYLHEGWISKEKTG